jgi:hypothetical protein
MGLCTILFLRVITDNHVSDYRFKFLIIKRFSGGDSASLKADTSYTSQNPGSILILILQGFKTPIFLQMDNNLNQYHSHALDLENLN